MLVCCNVLYLSKPGSSNFQKLCLKSKSESCSVVSDSLQPHGQYIQSQPGILQTRILGVDSLIPSPADLPNPPIKPRSPTLQADSLPAEPQEKPKNTGVGSPSLLQGIFLTQESNQGLLHCRWIVYQLSYQGSPKLCLHDFKPQVQTTDIWLGILHLKSWGMKGDVHI